MKKLISLSMAAITVLAMALPAQAALTHTVRRGDTMWKIASQYKVGTSEIISANPQVKNRISSIPARC